MSKLFFFHFFVHFPLLFPMNDGHEIEAQITQQISAQFNKEQCSDKINSFIGALITSSNPDQKSELTQQDREEKIRHFLLMTSE